MKNYSRILGVILFLLFFAVSFYTQKTVVIQFDDVIYPVLTYTNDISGFLHSIESSHLMHKLEEDVLYDKMSDGMVIKVNGKMIKGK